LKEEKGKLTGEEGQKRKRGMEKARPCLFLWKGGGWGKPPRGHEEKGGKVPKP